MLMPFFFGGQLVKVAVDLHQDHRYDSEDQRDNTEKEAVAA